MTSKEDYNQWLEDNIHNEYEIAEPEAVDNAVAEQRGIVQKLDLKERVFATLKRDAYITVKDHKENFQNNPKFRLISPSKPEININRRRGNNYCRVSDLLKPIKSDILQNVYL